MSNSSTDWANLDSAHERVVSAAVPLGRLASVADPVTDPAARSALGPAPSPATEPEPSAGSAQYPAGKSQPRPAAGSEPRPATGSQAGPATGIEPRPATGESQPDRAAGSHSGRPASWRRPRPAAAGRGRHRRTPVAAAAVTAAAACALAVPVSASATPAQPAAAASWKIIKYVHGGGGPQFSAITATSKSSAWAFEAFAASSAKPAAWRLSGSTWSKVPFPGRRGEQVAVAGSSSAGNVWAITVAGSRSRALRWNGSTWASTGSLRTDADSVTVISRSDVWVFGAPDVPSHAGAWHYNGHTWARVASGHGLTAGSALGHRSVWAVGGKSVAHWNGHTWSRTSVASLLPANTTLSQSSLVSIYARSSRNVWAVGTGGRQDEGGPTVLLHYNGHAWSHVATELSGNPAQVVPDGSGGLWIPVPSVDGIPLKMLRYSSGHLLPAALPISGRRLNVLAVAAIPHTNETFGAGFRHRTDNLGLGDIAAILAYQR